MQDIHNNIQPFGGMFPVAPTLDNTAYVSQIVDVSGYDACEFVLLTGAIASAAATFTVLVQDGNVANLSDAATVAANDLIGTVTDATPLFTSDNSVLKIGYRGGKRYVRVTVTPAGNTAALSLAAVWILGHPGSAPTANPPA